MSLPGLFPVLHSESTPTITFLHSTRNATTTASISFGTATPTTPGLLVVTILSTSVTTRLITDVTIGGSTGTLHVVSAGAANQRALASLVVSSGAKAISVTYNTTTNTAGGGVGAWLITGYNSTAPFDSGSATASGSTTVSLARAYPRNGVGVASAIGNSTAAMGMTGATTVASSTQGTTLRCDWASITSSVANASLTVSATGAAATDRRIVYGAWY